MARSDYIWIVVWNDNDTATFTGPDIESFIYNIEVREDVIAIIRKELA